MMRHTVHSIRFGSLLDVLVQVFAVLPRLDAVIIAHVEHVEDIGQMVTVEAVEEKDIVLGRQGHGNDACRKVP